jgi:hypothetical protein
MHTISIKIFAVIIRRPINFYSFINCVCYRDLYIEKTTVLNKGNQTNKQKHVFTTFIFVTKLQSHSA